MRGINLESAPREGFLLAYFRDALVFEPYRIEDGVLVFDGCEAFREETPRECHLFDENTEYRMVLREARNDRIESVLTKEEEEGMDPDLLFAEEALVKKEHIREGIHPKRLMIINRYRYTENDSLALKNYRISYCH